MRTIEQRIPFIQQGDRPWCWAACCAMSIGYIKAPRYAPSLADIVEFVKMQPKGSCEADPPTESLEGSHLHCMRVAIAHLGRRQTSTAPPPSLADLMAIMQANDVAILAVPGHVMVASGVRLSGNSSPKAEVRINDPALPSPYWTRFSNIEPSLTNCLVMHVKKYA